MMLARPFDILLLCDDREDIAATLREHINSLIAFSRHFRNGSGQIFGLAVMAVAASEVCVGLGLVVAINRKRLALDVDRLSELRG